VYRCSNYGKTNSIFGTWFPGQKSTRTCVSFGCCPFFCMDYVLPSSSVSFVREFWCCLKEINHELPFFCQLKSSLGLKCMALHSTCVSAQDKNCLQIFVCLGLLSIRFFMVKSGKRVFWMDCMYKYIYIYVCLTSYGKNCETYLVLTHGFVERSNNLRMAWRRLYICV
jgi:hypothetical protein